MKIARFTSCLPVLFAYCLVFALSAPSPPAPMQKQAPVARVTTRLVQVNVVVQDRKGQPITDLKQDDFEVTEQGKLQKISAFSIESNQKAVGRTGALPANTFSNMPSSAGATQNLTVILFDTLNTPVADQMSAKREVIGFLQQIEPQDRIALYGLGNSLSVMHDFTGNSEALVRALAHYRIGLSREVANSTPEIVDNTPSALKAQEAAIIEQMDRFLNESNQLAADVYIERRMSLTLSAIESISYHLAALPGRKSLVWVSASFPFSYGSDVFEVNRANAGSKNFSDAITRVARAVTSANVAIYPVDARGFMSAAALNPSSSAATVVNSARQAQRTDSGAMDQILSAHNTMQEMAERTGGRALYNTSDVQGAIRRALDDSRVTYTLGYYPLEAKFDGKFRTIKVSVNRPGAQLKYRRGYFAFPDEPLDDAHRQSAINAAAIRLLDSAGVGFSVQVDRPTTAPGAPIQQESIGQFALDIDTKALMLDPEQDTWNGGLDLVFAQFDGSGNIVATTGRTVPLRLTATQHEQLLKDGLVLNAPVRINAKSEKIRVIIRDTKSGAVGTLTVPLK
jgi:VWFA-related protein